MASPAPSAGTSPEWQASIAVDELPVLPVPQQAGVPKLLQTSVQPSETPAAESRWGAELHQCAILSCWLDIFLWQPQQNHYARQQGQCIAARHHSGCRSRFCICLHAMHGVRCCFSACHFGLSQSACIALPHLRPQEAWSSAAHTNLLMQICSLCVQSTPVRQPVAACAADSGHIPARHVLQPHAVHWHDARCCSGRRPACVRRHSKPRPAPQLQVLPMPLHQLC